MLELDFVSRDTPWSCSLVIVSFVTSLVLLILQLRSPTDEYRKYTPHHTRDVYSLDAKFCNP